MPSLWRRRGTLIFFDMKVKIKWVGNKRKFWEDIQNLVEENGEYLLIEHVEEVTIFE